jgi:hypothetical protein
VKEIISPFAAIYRVIDQITIKDSISNLTSEKNEEIQQAINDVLEQLTEKERIHNEFGRRDHEIL